MGDVMINIEGGKALEEALAALGDPKFMRRAALKALREAAIPIRDKAKMLVPVDQGDLREAISVKAGRRGRGEEQDRITYLVGIDSSVQPAVYRARQSGSGAYRDPGVAGNAVIQELGTVHMAANPFLLPAFDGERAATPGRITTVLGPAIEDQARKMARKAMT